MTDEQIVQKCKDALQTLEDCTEREVEEYGEAEYQEVKEMESEAPAPSPCVDQFNAVVEALLKYSGSPDDFELGRHRKAIHASLKAKQAQ